MTTTTTLETITDKYLSANRRLLILDYDGTLASFKPMPPEAKPSSSLLNLLRELSSDPANDVSILSGRDRATLTSWFGNLPIALGAEHGFFVKPIGGNWHPTRHAELDWRPAVKAVMEEIRLPGAYVEEKAIGLAWQYRRSDPHAARRAAKRLIAELSSISDGLGLNIMHGNRVVEVLPPGANKGTAAKHWLSLCDYNFVLAAGDDRTDADLFRALPEHGFSIDIGKPGIASTALPSPGALREYLKTLAKA
jgi:trehalose 6-phosphate synthase/phosphatase